MYFWMQRNPHRVCTHIGSWLGPISQMDVSIWRSVFLYSLFRPALNTKTERSSGCFPHPLRIDCYSFYFEYQQVIKNTWRPFSFSIKGKHLTNTCGSYEFLMICRYSNCNPVRRSSSALIAMWSHHDSIDQHQVSSNPSFPEGQLTFVACSVIIVPSSGLKYRLSLV